jgi:colanic acid/amylovoran biosynthesis glycosyltransferase
MKNKRLAILAPRWGMPSETFVRRHLTDIMPGMTVGITRDIIDRNWCENIPRFSLNDINECALVGAARNFGWSIPSTRVKHLKTFLEENQVAAIMGEWLNFSCKWYDSLHSESIRYVAHAHGYDVTTRALNQKKNVFLYRKLHHMHAIVTVSELTRQRLIQVIGLEPQKIHVIPCGVEVPPIKQKTTANGLVKIICVGRMVAKKGQIYALKAFQKVFRSLPNLRLEFVGDGRELQKCQNFVKEHHMSDQDVFHGSLSQNQVFSLMEQADIFLLHSIVSDDGDEEGLPVAILEAMARGLPVISTFHAGIPEAIVDGVHGTLVDERDIDSLTEAMIMLYHDELMRRKLGSAARQRVIESYSASYEAECLKNLMFAG